MHFADLAALTGLLAQANSRLCRVLGMFGSLAVKALRPA
jgi:hypothetical protein